jgi:hypothetical protein
VIEIGASPCGVAAQEQEGEMSLLRSVFKRGRVVSESKLDHIGESSVDALRRVEAECDWSDAALLFTELVPESHQPKEPPACRG